MSSINSVILGVLIGGGLVVYNKITDIKKYFIDPTINIFGKIKDTPTNIYNKLLSVPEDMGAADK